MATRSFLFGRRDTFATELLVRTVEELLGHESVEARMIYDRIVNDGPSMRSRLEELFRNDLPA